MFVGITGLDGKNVRPRWQEDVPNLPDFGTDWCALGVMKITADTNTVNWHDPVGTSGNGAEDLRRNEEVDILTSFYGPNSDANAALLRDGLQVEQNRYLLRNAQMELIETSDILTTSEPIKSRWVRKHDITVRIRRLVLRVYPVLNILSAQGTINNEHYLTIIKAP